MPSENQEQHRPSEQKTDEILRNRELSKIPSYAKKILLRLPPCKHAESIMEEHDYPGLRFTLIGTLDGLRQKCFKIDISTGDAITPQVIEYRYPLMFENRSLQIMSYNLERCLPRNWKPSCTVAQARHGCAIFTTFIC